MTSIIAIYNITEISYLNNSYIDIIIYNASIKTEYLVYFLPISIVIFHLFMVESLRLHYYKVLSYIKYNNSSNKKNIKSLLLYPFVFNDTRLYYPKEKGISFTLILSIIILLILPMVVIHSTIIYSEFPNLIIWYIVAIAIINIFYSILIFKKYLIVLTIIIIYSCGIALYNENINFHIQNGYPIKFLKKDITPIQKNIFYKENSVFNDINTKYIKYAKGIEIKNRKLNKLILNQSNIANTLFINTVFNGFVGKESKLINNQYINSDLNNFVFTGTDLISLKFEGEFIENDSYKYKTNIRNWNLWHTNTIQDSLFKDVTISNMNINNSSIINTIFDTGNNYQNFKIKDSKLFSNLFSGNIFGLSDEKLAEKIKTLENRPYYQKAINNTLSSKYIKKNGLSFSETLKDIRSKEYYKSLLYKKSKKEKDEKIIYLKTLEKDLIFDTVNLKGTIFNNVTFKNALFLNTDFSNVAFINTKFINCTFRFTQDYIKSKDLSYLSGAKLDNNCTIIYNNKISDDKFPQYSKKDELNKNIKLKKLIFSERKKIACSNINSQVNILEQLHTLKLDKYYNNMKLYINDNCKKL